MFQSSIFTGNLSAWPVTTVKDFSSLFEQSHFNGDLSRWDMSGATDVSAMFRHGVFNGDVAQWNVANVEDFSNMFFGSLFERDISPWSISVDACINAMFHNKDLLRSKTPSVYHWYLALLEPDVQLQKDWQQHLQEHCFLVQSLGLQNVEAAIQIHDQWLNRTRCSNMCEELALPLLDE